MATLAVEVDQDITLETLENMAWAWKLNILQVPDGRLIVWKNGCGFNTFYTLDEAYEELHRLRREG